jgi:hypothetical protein
MAATRYWSVEECRWVDPPAVEQPDVPEQGARLDDDVLGLPRQRGFDELSERSREGVEG